MPDYTVLRNEITGDPLARGYANMTAEQVAADLNTPYRVRVVPQVPINQVAMWAAKTGVRAKIEAHAQNVASPVQSVCLALVDLFRGLGSPTLDLGSADNLAMCNALITVGVMTAEQKASLLALQHQPISRAIELEGWTIPVQAPDIERARSL